MAYETYKEPLSKKDYFEKWSGENVSQIEETIKDEIYEKYLIKGSVLRRDNFKCQNIKCLHTNSELTMHHIRFQRNNGPHSLRNCVTLCKTCHKAFHRRKIELVFGDNPLLPAHIRGKTFREHIENEINWKEVKAELKKFRKTIRDQHGVKLTWKQISILMRFLQTPYDED